MVRQGREVHGKFELPGIQAMGTAAGGGKLMGTGAWLPAEEEPAERKNSGRRGGLSCRALAGTACGGTEQGICTSRQVN